MSPIALVGQTITICPCEPGSPPATVITGAMSTFVENLPVARGGDLVSCPAVIIARTLNVFVENQPIALVGDIHTCGGNLINGSISTFMGV
jgi:uncharacterized Zn-binding protein involved in type VI secretion